MRYAVVAVMSFTTAFGPPPIEHAYAEVNDVRLHYAKSGSGELMLFLHGFPEFWYAWKSQLEEFGKEHLVIAPDMRGYNLSSKPEGVDNYSIPILIEDVRALAAQLGFGRDRKFTLVGHDWGGAIAWAYAAAHPDTLDKLVIVNGPHPTVFGRLLREDRAQQKASSYMLLFRSPQAEATLSEDNYQRLVDMVLGAGLKSGAFTEEDKQAYLGAWSQPGALTGGLNYYRAAQLGPPSAREVAPKPGDAESRGKVDPSAPLIINVPTLVIWGEQDTALLTSNLDGLEQYVAQLTVKRIPDGTHWVVHEKPAEINRYIREFVAR